MLWETSVPVKHLIKKASPALLNFTKSTGSRAENVRKFSLCARIRLHDYFRTAKAIHEKILFDTFPEFSE